MTKEQSSSAKDKAEKEEDKKKIKFDKHEDVKDVKSGAEIGKIDKCANCEESENKYKRALADYQNLLKRTAKEKEEFFKYANEQLIIEFIPVYDNLKMSLNHTDEQVEKSPWLEGVKYVLKQFKSILEGAGIEEIKTVGEKFDHNFMEAIEGNGDMVVKELKPGYRLNGKVIIAARVALGE